MKKVLALALTLVLVLSLVACGGNSDSTEEKREDTATESPAETESPKLSLGERVSTDIADFTLKDAKLSYYASSSSSTFGEPTSTADYNGKGIFKAAKGRVLVCMTFKIKNNDRDTLNFGDIFEGWRLVFTLCYKGNQYGLKGYDLNHKDGDSFGIRLGHAGVSYDDGNTWDMNPTQNVLMRPGQTLTFRVVTVAVVDPDSLNDPFEIIAYVPTSSGWENYTYAVS